MNKKSEYQGGGYALIEAFGAYIRYWFYVIIRKKKSLSYLSGEDQYPIIDKRQRFFCLIVGIFGICSTIIFCMLLLCFS